MNSIKTNLESFPAFFKVIRLVLITNSIAAFMAILWVFLIPSDTNESSWLGYSIYRWGEIIILFFGGIANLWLNSRSGKQLASWLQIILPDNGVRLWVICVSLGCVVLCNWLGFVLAQQPEHQAVLERMHPILLWIAWVCLGGSIAIGLFDRFLWRDLLTGWSELKKNRPVVGKIKQYGILVPAVFLGLFLAYWWKTGKQLFPMTPLHLSGYLIGAGLFLGLAAVFYRRGLTRLISWCGLFLLGLLPLINMGSFNQVELVAGKILKPLADNEIITLARASRFSLSLYEVLNDFYAGRILMSSDELIKDWNLSTEQLVHWSKLDVRSGQNACSLTTEEVKQIALTGAEQLTLNDRSEMVTYTFFPAAQKGAGKLYVMEFEEQRYFIPGELSDTLMPGRCQP